MRLWILSDLHQEFPQFAWRPDHTPQHDVLVLAGDIHNPIDKSIAYGRSLTDNPLILVAGNHEYYGATIEETLARGQAEAAKFENVHCLENDSVTIQGVRFVGATLWTDMLLPVLGSGTQLTRQHVIAKEMNDYRTIKRIGETTGKRRRLRPCDTIERHAKSRCYIEEQLAKHHAGPTVVVTHHAPIPNAFAPNTTNTPTAPAYASDLKDLINHYQPNAWIYGHTHMAQNTKIGNTRIVSNPKGYRGEETGFKLQLTIDF